MGLNSKYSTIALIFIMIIGAIGAISALSSEDINDLCNTNNSLLYKSAGEWQCGTGINLTDKTENQAICLKTTGTLGHCTTTVNSSGGCTCA